MADPDGNGRFKPPSGKRIAISSVVALAVALIVLVTVIWPAEYGRDPTGIGRLLGIEGMSTAATRTIEFAEVIGGNETLGEVEIPDFGEPVPLPNPDVARAEPGPPETITMSVELDPDARTEIKMVLAEGSMVVYDWEVVDGVVYSEFHGHTPEFGPDFWVMYKKDEQGAPTGHGSLVAPFSGEHGWYWVNIMDRPITINLTITGYVEDMIDYSSAF